MGKRVGLTQRLVAHDTERRDCLDQAWTAALAAEGHVPVPLPNAFQDADALLDALGIENLILTGGDDPVGTPDPTDPAHARDRFEHRALEWARRRNVPVLGVCRGMQMLTLARGGTLQPVAGHDQSVHGLSEAPSEFPSQVNSFHRFSVHRLGDDQEVLARSEDGVIEALRSTDTPTAGVMWHPERPPFSPDGPLALLGRLLRA